MDKIECQYHQMLLKLGKILNIEYGQSTVGAFKGLAVMAKASGSSLDLEPENLKGEVNVQLYGD